MSIKQAGVIKIQEMELWCLAAQCITRTTFIALKVLARELDIFETSQILSLQDNGLRSHTTLGFSRTLVEN